MLGTAQDGDRGRRLRKDVQQPPPLRLLDAADAPAQQLRFDAGDELARRKRLDDVVVRACLKSFDARFFAGASRQHHHGHSRVAGVFAELAKQLEAVELRHHDVGDDQIWRPLDCGAQGLTAVRHRCDVPRGLQQAANVLPHVRVVVGEQDPFAARTSTGCGPNGSDDRSCRS